jgi:cytochrome c oxidase subunit 2
MNLRHRFGHVFGLEVGIAAAVFVLVVVTVIVAVILSRARRGRRPSRKSEHPRLELAYTLVVAAVAGFVIFTSTSANASKDPGPPALVVRVTGFQWCWRFAYLATPVTNTGDCLGGKVPILDLPAGRRVEFQVTSADVVHSMWVPYLRFKMDAFPNHVNTFTTSFANPGSYPGRCAEFCGLYHSSMDFTVNVMPAGQFDGWLTGREDAARSAT